LYGGDGGQNIKHYTTSERERYRRIEIGRENKEEEEEEEEEHRRGHSIFFKINPLDLVSGGITP
jgi:hypothetical protein